MKHLKIYEEFENNSNVAKYQLEDNQVDDLHEQFDNFLEDMERQSGQKLTYDEILDFFIVDDNGQISDDFVRFLDYLEENTDWFNFEMMDKVKNDLEIILAHLVIMDIICLTKLNVLMHVNIIEERFFINFLLIIAFIQILFLIIFCIKIN